MARTYFKRMNLVTSSGSQVKLANETVGEVKRLGCEKTIAAHGGVNLNQADNVGIPQVAVSGSTSLYAENKDITQAYGLLGGKLSVQERDTWEPLCKELDDRLLAACLEKDIKFPFLLYFYPTGSGHEYLGLVRLAYLREHLPVRPSWV